MVWIRTLIICVFVSVLQAHKECTKHVRWELLLQSINSMGSAISHECVFDYEESSLCDARHLLNTMDHHAVFLNDIVKKAEILYRENPSPQSLMEALHHTRHTLNNCGHHSSSAEHESVTTCFNKLEAFLKKKAHSRCSWEIINSKLREIFQRMERRSVRRRR